MDDFQTRAIKSLRARHEKKARQAIKDIQDAADWLLRDLDANGGTPSHHARSILTDAGDLLWRVGQLEAIQETVEVLETSDEPAKETGQ